MIGNNLVGTVHSRDELGYYVEVFAAGQNVMYGPMHYVSPTGEFLEFIPGEHVLITSVFFRDQFVIIGKYMDMTPVPPPEEESNPGDHSKDVVWDLTEGMNP